MTEKIEARRLFSSIFRMTSFLYKAKSIFSNYRFIMGTYIIVSMVASGMKYFLPKDYYTYYENYLIFRNSFLHLIKHQNIYAAFPAEQWDLYKYSPSFAVFMGFFAYLPNLPGLLLWSAVNALIVYYAIKTLPLKNKGIKVSLLWFVLLELMTSIQSAQSNGLMAGLIILTFVYLEKKNYFLAALMVVCSMYIKIFGVVAVALFIFYPQKVKSIAYLVFWSLMIGLLPLLFISTAELQQMYNHWLTLLSSDHSASLGMSVMAMLKIYFGFSVNKIFIVAAGALILLTPLIRTDLYKEFFFRTLYLAAILIWMIIFNHKAESPTFIIAICGVGLWYFIQEKSSINFTLLVFTFVFTCLSPTDIFPSYLRHNFTDVYVLKMLPCFFVWVKIIYELLSQTYTIKSSFSNDGSARVVH